MELCTSSVDIAVDPCQPQIPADISISQFTCPRVKDTEHLQGHICGGLWQNLQLGTRHVKIQTSCEIAQKALTSATASEYNWGGTSPERGGKTIIINHLDHHTWMNLNSESHPRLAHVHALASCWRVGDLGSKPANFNRGGQSIVHLALSIQIIMLGIYGCIFDPDLICEILKGHVQGRLR